jgi:hypothetical protein
MKAEVPYLARLARQATGQPTLRPPRQLFTGDVDLPADSPGFPGSPGSARRHAIDAPGPRLLGSLPMADGGHEQLMPEASAPASQGGGVEPAAAGNAPATPAGPEPAVAIRMTPDSPDRHLPPQAAPQWPGAGPDEVPGTTVASPAEIRPVTPPAEPRPAGDARPAVDGPARPPKWWASSLSDGPMALPDALQPAPRAGQADHRAAPVSPTVPAELVPRAAHQTTFRPGAPPAADASDLDRIRQRTAVRDLMPQPADPPPVAISRTEPDEPRVPRRPRVSIGTIEVTVVPPTPPVPVIPEMRLPAPVPPGRSRPPSPFAASEGADRLRHGLRRWYGTAQE